MPDCPVILNSDSQLLFVYSFRIEFELFLNWLLPEFIIFFLKIFCSSAVDFFLIVITYISYFSLSFYLFAVLPFVSLSTAFLCSVMGL